MSAPTERVDPAGGDRPPNLESLVAHCLERLDEDGPRALDEICAAHPEHAGELRDRIAILADIGIGAQTPPPERLGPYTLGRLLGSGGMGAVYEAEQTEPIRRKVALKLVKRGMDSDEIIARFAAERQALARLDHDGIAKVLDVGQSDDGRPWFAMELVPGVPIDRFCDDRAMPLRARLELFEDLCAAVQHAHQLGILHRDLKPANVLVRTDDNGTEPRVKVIDFGLAKAVHEAGEPLRTQMTRVGEVLGTPEYMSPEQALGLEQNVDTRTDVYALGVVLYEFVAGCLPFASDELRQGTLFDVLRVVGEKERPRPTTRLRALPAERAAEIARRRGESDVDKLRARLCGDLEWICSRALALDRDERYASVSELAADVRRHLQHEPVLAGPPSTLYVVSRFVRRHRAAVAVVGLVLVVLVVSLIVSLRALQRAERNLAMFDRLAEGDRIEALLAQDRTEAPPPHPDALPALLAWRAEVADLLERRPGLVADRDRLREQAGVAGEDGSWTFAEPRSRILHEGIEALLARLDAADAENGPRDWVERRIAWAEQVVPATVEAYAEDWVATRARVAANARYGALDLPPQAGLIPLGPDPISTLEEFAFWCPEGISIPARDGDGHLVLREDSAAVLVLIPGSESAWVGASDDPEQPNYDPAAKAHEGPVVAVRMVPYFIGKHELTQAQWSAIRGTSPSLYNQDEVLLAEDGSTVETYGDRHPVERVSWTEADEALRGAGLDMPTEARWEHAARAGSATPWFTGPDAESVRAAGNLADASAKRIIRNVEGSVPWRDGFVTHAPVGSFEPNAFGLHDTIGNVWEWCKDGYTSERRARGFRPGDGLYVVESLRRPIRGSSWQSGTHPARSSFRLAYPPEGRQPAIGVRCARPVQLRE